MRPMMPKANTMSNARVEDWLQNAEIAENSTVAVIMNVEDDGEEVTSKFTPIPNKSFWGCIKEFFKTRHNFGRYPFGSF